MNVIQGSELKGAVNLLKDSWQWDLIYSPIIVWAVCLPYDNGGGPILICWTKEYAESVAKKSGSKFEVYETTLCGLCDIEKEVCEWQPTELQEE